MRNKLLQIRADEEFLSKLEYLREIFGFKTKSETVRAIVDKEWKKETLQPAIYNPINPVLAEGARFAPGTLVTVSDTNRGCIYTTQVDGSGNLWLESQRNVVTVKKEMSEIDSCIYDAYYCPKCGKRIGTIKENYCSNCGIKLGY